MTKGAPTMKRIVKTNVVKSADMAEFKELLDQFINQYQDEGLQVDVSYSFAIQSLLVQYYTALVTGYTT